MGEPPTEKWRPIIAALANDDARRAFARLALGLDGDPFEGLSPSRRIHVREQLAKAELIGDADGAPTLRPGVFAELLRRSASARPGGIERFLRDGRIAQYPARPSERLELLEWIAAHTLGAGEVVDERELNGRLGRFTDDCAALRRYLVDAGLVERTATGSEYALPSD